MPDRQVLVVTQDIELYHSIRNSIHDGITDICRTTSEIDALNSLLQGNYSLIIIDIPSLETDGLELLHIIRERTPVPILSLVEKTESSEKIALFRAGANACFEKPVDWTLCAAQANSLIRLYMEAQTEDHTNQPLIFGTELIIHPIYHQVIVDGEQLPLTRKEFDLLLCLARHPGQVWSRTQLYNQVWRDNPGISGENAVRVHIGNLRKKLSGMGKAYIQTSWDVGYKFVPPTEIVKKKLI